MKKMILFLIVFTSLSGKTITPKDVYAQTILIQEHVRFLLKNYGIKHNDTNLDKKSMIRTQLKPRNAWQKGYEILIKINMLRVSHNLSRIEPVGVEPVEQLNPDMVYGQTQRILTEIKIFEVRKGISVPHFQTKKFYKKTPMDVYNIFTGISASLDELNRSELSPSYVFSETMRVYDDLTIILKHLNVGDTTIPTIRLKSATPHDSLQVSLKVLEKIQRLQRKVGIQTVDFSSFNKEKASPSDVYTITEMILAELQPIKAYIGLTTYVTPPALMYHKKVPADIEQLMGWNLRKITLIQNLDRR